MDTRLNLLINKIGNVDFEVTFSCNLRCLHCYNLSHDKKNELSLKKIKDKRYYKTD